MLSPEVIEKINQQIGLEFYSAYLYLQFSVEFEKQSLFGFQKWYSVQAAEEVTHAQKFIKYLQDNDADVILPAIKKPDADLSDNGKILQAAFNHELFITKSINDIQVLAGSKDDFRTVHFLDWFHDEQTEDEKNASNLLKQYGMFGNETKGLVVLDEELGQRQE